MRDVNADFDMISDLVSSLLKNGMMLKCWREIWSSDDWLAELDRKKHRQKSSQFYPMSSAWSRKSLGHMAEPRSCQASCVTLDARA